MKKNIWFWSITLVVGSMISCTNRTSVDKEVFVVNPSMSDSKATESLAQRTEYKLMQFQTHDSLGFAASASSVVTAPASQSAPMFFVG